MAAQLKQRTRRPEEDEASNSTARSASPPLEDKTVKMADSKSKGKSLNDRGRIPPSFFVTFGTILGLEYFSGFWRLETLESWFSSLKESTLTLKDLIGYAFSVALGKENLAFTEYLQTGMIVLTCSLLFYVFFVAPLMSGFWTGRKSRRALFHRYMGLSYLFHYLLAGVELFTNYGAAKHSYLCHIVAVNGILQSSSAFLSFKVLPELNDAGYYSDKAVLSRTFVHENMFFGVMTCFGSMYYYEDTRAAMRSTLGGRFIEYIYVFWPYVAVRSWYPRTRFSDAGQTHNGRTGSNQRFYEIGTMMVKFFYLWAKYFLGFFMSFMIFLDLIEDEYWHFMHGMLLLNTGTVSLAMFLHTLRFKKVLPAKFTFSLYLVQIYLTFTAIPMALHMFASHPKICGLCLAGLLVNMTRNHKLHALWCAVSMYLLTQTNIEW